MELIELFVWLKQLYIFRCVIIVSSEENILQQFTLLSKVCISVTSFELY